MEISRIILGIVYVAVAIFLLYRLFYKKNPYQREYEKIYNEILTSDKYKVKGQYDR